MSSKDTIIADLRKLVEKRAKQINAQAKQIDALTEELNQLKIQLAKANKNSSNSCTPPLKQNWLERQLRASWTSKVVNGYELLPIRLRERRS